MSKMWTEDQRLDDIPYPIRLDFIRQMNKLSELIEADIKFLYSYAGGSVVQIFVSVSKHGLPEWDEAYILPSTQSPTVGSVRAHFRGFQFALWVEQPLPKDAIFLPELQMEFYKQNLEAVGVRARAKT